MRSRLFLILSSLALSVSVAHAAKFIDTVNHPHEVYIDALADYGIVQGYGYGIFRPDQPINRAEFLKILMLAVFGDEAANVYNNRCFTDFTGAEQWFWDVACYAKEHGIIGGYPDGTFRGAQTVNLAEAMKMATRAWGIGVSSGQYAPEYWYIPYFEVAADRGLFQYFPRSGAHLLTRSDMAYLIVSMGEPIQNVTSSSSASSVPTGNGVCGNNVLEYPEQCDDGNLEDGDGCSSICVIVPEPTRHGALRIDQRIVSNQTLAPGAKDVTLFAFDAIAGRQDLALTHLSLRAFTGSLAVASNYRLYADVDGNGDAEQLVASAAANGGTLTFAPLSVTVPDGAAVRAEVVADLQASTTSGAFGLEFNFANTRFVQAIGLADARDLSGIQVDNAPCAESSICWIAVHTADADPFEIRTRGNLFISADSTPVRSRILVGGEESPDLLRLRFRATGEPIEVTDLRLIADDGVFTALELRKEGQNSAESLRAVSCSPVTTNHFCTASDIVIPQNEEVVYVVRGIVKSEGEGLDSGDYVTIRLAADPTKPAMQAQGASSKDTLAANDGDTSEDGEIFLGRSIPGADQDIVGPTHDVAFAKIERIENANDDPDQTSIPTGTQTFGVFRFTAAENDNTENGVRSVLLKNLVFSVSATNVQFLTDSFKLMNMEDPSILHDCSATGYTGQITVTCSGIDASDVNGEIEPGDSTELGLRGFIVNPQVENGSSVLQASLQSLGSRGTSGSVEWTDGSASFGWVDLDTTNVRSTAYSQ